MVVRFADSDDPKSDCEGPTFANENNVEVLSVDESDLLPESDPRSVARCPLPGDIVWKISRLPDETVRNLQHFIAQTSISQRRRKVGGLLNRRLRPYQRIITGKGIWEQAGFPWLIPLISVLPSSHVTFLIDSKACSCPFPSKALSMVQERARLSPNAWSWRIEEWKRRDDENSASIYPPFHTYPLLHQRDAYFPLIVLIVLSGVLQCGHVGSRQITYLKRHAILVHSNNIPMWEEPMTTAKVLLLWIPYTAT